MVKSRYLSLGPVEIGGVKEEIVKYEKLPPRAEMTDGMSIGIVTMKTSLMASHTFIM